MATTILLALWGLILGLLVGFTSVGTGILGGPALILLFGTEPLRAVGSITVAALCMMAAGAYRHLRSKNIAWQPVLPFLLGALPAAFLTASYADLITGYIPIKYIIGGVIFISLPLLLYRFLKKNPPEPAQGTTPLRRIFALPAGIILGAVMGATGIVGSITLVLFLLLFRLPAALAVGSTSFVGFCSLLLASLAHGINGNVDPDIVLTLLPGVLIGALVGAHYVKKVPQGLLQFAIIMLLFVSGLMILR